MVSQWINQNVQLEFTYHLFIWLQKVILIQMVESRYFSSPATLITESIYRQKNAPTFVSRVKAPKVLCCTLIYNFKGLKAELDPNTAKLG